MIQRLSAFLLITMIFSACTHFRGISPKQSSATVISPIFGVHVVLNRNAPPNADVIRSLGAKVTTLWLYPAPGGRFNVSQATQMVNWITEQTGGLKVYVHLMPNARSEAMGSGAFGDPELPEGGGGFSCPRI
jgi:hypothetical protein